MFSFVHSLSFFFNVPIVLLFLMSGGIEFHTEADLTMKDFLDRENSTTGIMKLPWSAVLVLDG